MKLYIASHSQEAAKRLQRRLEEAGHEVVARWIEQDSKFGHGIRAYSDQERTELALMDEEDVRRSDALVVISEPDGRTVPGGKHVETGMALALMLGVYVLGRRENLFHWHPNVKVLESESQLLAILSSTHEGNCRSASSPTPA